MLCGSGGTDTKAGTHRNKLNSSRRSTLQTLQQSPARRPPILLLQKIFCMGRLVAATPAPARLRFLVNGFYIKTKKQVDLGGIAFFKQWTV